MNKYLYILSFCAFLFTSCENVREYSVESFERKVVVDAVLKVDSIWNIKLTYNKALHEQEFVSITNAEVNIEVFDEEKSLLKFQLEHIGDGVYTRGNNPTEGRTFKLEVIVDDIVVEAVTIMPKVINVKVGEKREVIEKSTDQTKFYELDIEIEEPLGQENYYVWQMYTNPAYIAFVDSIGSIVKVETDPIADAYTEEETYDNTDKKDIVLRNKLIILPVEAGGGKVTFSSEVQGTDSSGNHINIDQPHRPKRHILSVLAVSEDYYHFLRTTEGISNNPINSSNTIPRQYYSNIQNGEGIFGGYIIKQFEQD